MVKSDKPSKRIETRPQLVVAEMSSGRDISFDLVFDRDQLQSARAQLGILDVQKLRLTGKLTPHGRHDWALNATIGASVTQACVVTLAPVKTRVDEAVTRIFVADWKEPEADSVLEMPDNVEQEPLGSVIDLENIAIEAVALAMPDYPRSENATLEETVFAGPEVKPMTDDDAKPFAALAALKDKLDKK